MSAASIKKEEEDVKPAASISSSNAIASTSRLPAAAAADAKPAVGIDVKPAPAALKSPADVKPAPSKLAGLDFDLDEIEKLLSQDETLVNREQEVLRVLNAFRLNPYQILDLDFWPIGAASMDDIRKSYRKRSLLIHPDKLKHPRGIEAFDLLKKASTELEDPERRKYIDQTVADARMLLMRALKLPDNAPDTHVKVQNMQPPLREQMIVKMKEILIDDELRKRRSNRVQMIAEGAAAAEKEKEVAERKRKLDEARQWEDSREGRVSDWRQFQAHKGKKTKRSGYLG